MMFLLGTDWLDKVRARSIYPEKIFEIYDRQANQRIQVVQRDKTIRLVVPDWLCRRRFKVRPQLHLPPPPEEDRPIPITEPVKSPQTEENHLILTAEPVLVPTEKQSATINRQNKALIDGFIEG